MLQKSAAVVLGLLIGTAAHAELYKKVDEQGNITYSDVPSGAAKPVQPPGLTTYGTPNQHKQTSKKPADPAKAAAATVYTALAIANPVNNEALRDNSGTVTVKITLAPQLDTKSGHKLIALLDQKPAAEAQAGEIALKDVERGAHALKVQVTDATGHVLKESAEINFQLHRGSTAGARKGK